MFPIPTANIKSKIPNKEIPFLISTPNYNPNPIPLIKITKPHELNNSSTNVDNKNIEIMDIQNYKTQIKDTHLNPRVSHHYYLLPNSSKVNVMKDSKNNPIKIKIKKFKIRSRFNSSTKNIENLEDQLKLAINIFLQNKDIHINFDLFKHILENFSNKNINIHDLCKRVGTYTQDLLKIV